MAVPRAVEERGRFFLFAMRLFFLILLSVSCGRSVVGSFNDCSYVFGSIRDGMSSGSGSCSGSGNGKQVRFVRVSKSTGLRLWITTIEKSQHHMLGE
jgi:hypothetical protein